MNIDQENRLRALATHIGESYEALLGDTNAWDVFNPWFGEGEAFTIGGMEFYVLTDKEADNAARAYIEENLWAFKASFLVDRMGLPYDFEEVLQAYQEKKCEGANDLIKALLVKTAADTVDDPIEEFALEAISQDGRGHFLSTYNGVENEVGDFFIYRAN